MVHRSYRCAVTANAMHDCGPLIPHRLYTYHTPLFSCSHESYFSRSFKFQNRIVYTHEISKRTAPEAEPVLVLRTSKPVLKINVNVAVSKHLHPHQRRSSRAARTVSYSGSRRVGRSGARSPLRRPRRSHTRCRRRSPRPIPQRGCCHRRTCAAACALARSSLGPPCRLLDGALSGALGIGAEWPRPQR